MMTVVTPMPASPLSRVQQARAEIIELIAMRAINDRLSASRPDDLPGKTGIYIEHGEQGHQLIMLWDNFAADEWRPAIAGLRKTTCELATTGFSTAEWVTAGRNVIGDLEHRAGEMASAPNVHLAIDLSHALADDRDLIPPDELLRYARAMVPEMNVRLGTDWWRRQWRRDNEHLRVETPDLAKTDDPLSAIRRAANGAVDVPACKVIG